MQSQLEKTFAIHSYCFEYKRFIRGLSFTGASRSFENTVNWFQE